MKTTTMTESQRIQFLNDMREDMMEEGVTNSDRDPYDPVNHPVHYQANSGLEAIDVIDSFVPDNYSYYMGNVLKYVLRHVNKNQKQDLEKARWYLDKMIEDWD